MVTGPQLICLRRTHPIDRDPILDGPLVSITIPTFNEETDLPRCLHSVQEQSYRNVEVIAIDGGSSDNTIGICESFGASVAKCSQGLMQARLLGLQMARGEYVLLLDADQLLSHDTIQRALSEIPGYDMLVLEEGSASEDTWVGRALAKERLLTHEADNALDPVEGGLMPRFFRRDFLLAVFANIPSAEVRSIVSSDHAIIYYEARRLSSKVKLLSKALFHIEENGLRTLFLHNYRFGRTTRILLHGSSYSDLIRRKTSLRRSSVILPLRARTPTLFPVMAIRTLGFRLGFLLG
jgi:glycosyltransferase involved in cell wall biosynthesis